MYCKSCERFFDEDKAAVNHDEETNATELFCPYCGSEEVTGSLFCPCGEEIVEGENFCSDCMDTVELGITRLRAKLKYSKSDFEDIITEFFGW